MKKKLSLLMVAFFSVVAFATTMTLKVMAAEEESTESEVVFDIAANPWGHELGSGSTSETQTPGNITEPIVESGVTLAFEQGSGSTPPRFWTGPQIRVYNGNNFSLTAPEGKAIKKIEITSNNNSYTSVPEGLTNNTWEGNSTSVIFYPSATVQLTKIVVTIADKDENTTTPTTPPSIANTIDDPYTVSEAYDLIDAGEALDDVVFVEGKISAITEVSTSYGNATYKITDGVKDLTVYRGYYLDGEKFTSEDQIEIGATVIVTGKLTNYNGTYEFTTGNKIAKYTAPATDVEISPESGDISTALATAIEGKNVGNITINLAEGATYTITSSIVAPASFTLNGNGATIDASGLTGAMVTTPEGELSEWFVGDFLVKDVTIKGLAKALYANAGKNYLYNTFKVENSVVELTANITYFDFTKGGVANLTINNSTLYGAVEHTKTLYSSQGGQKANDYNDDATQTFIISSSTLYNIAKGANFFTHRSNSQKWETYVLKNSIFVNVGKSGQVVKGINGGGSSANPVYDIDGNAFNFDGEDTSASETTGNDDVYPVKNSVAGTIEFTDATAGDFGGTFTLAEGATEPETLGDPRWTITFKTATGIESIKVNNADGEVWYNLNGMRIEKPANGGIYIHNGKKVVIK